MFTISAMNPARNAAKRTVPTVHTKILRLTMMQPRSTYFFFFCSPGPRSQLCCVSSKGRDNAALSKSCRFLLRSSSVAESVALISNGPPHGSLPYILAPFVFSLQRCHRHNTQHNTTHCFFESANSDVWLLSISRTACLVLVLAVLFLPFFFFNFL